MKSRFLIFTTLFLAVLCFGSASNAIAQSVTGGGTVNSEIASGTVNVSARGGEDQPPAGTLVVNVIFHETHEHVNSVARVVDLCVVDNEAVVVADITNSTLPDEESQFLILYVRDNGNNGDMVQVLVSTGSADCEILFDNLDGELDEGLLLTGNIRVTP